MTPINQLPSHGNMTVPLPPLTSNGSSGSSSGHSSMSGCTAVPPISSSSSFDMVIEGASNPHLRLIPSSSPSSPSSTTSSPSTRVYNSQQGTYFPSTYSPMSCKDTRSLNNQHPNFCSTQTNYIQNGHEKVRIR